MALALLALAGPAWATEADDPVASDRLNQVGSAIGQIRDQGAALARELDQVEAELSGLRAQLVRATDQVMVLHRQIATVEAEIAALDAASDDLRQRIAVGQGQIVAMVQSLHRLARVPAGLLLGRPGAPMERFRAGVMIRSGIETVRAAVADQEVRIARAGQIREAHIRQHERLLALRAELELRTASLRSDVERRQWLIDRARQAVSLTQSPLDQIAEETGDLSRIVADLETREPPRVAGQGALAAALRDVVAEARSGGPDSLADPGAPTDPELPQLSGLWFGSDDPAAGIDPTLDPLLPEDGLTFGSVPPAVPLDDLLGGEPVALPARPPDGAAAGTAIAAGSTAPTRALLPLPVIDGVVLPVDGWVESRYGDPDLLGQPLRGLRIRTGAGSPVVAPLDGRVRYAGDLLSYGQTLILEHSDGYHSVIAGLGQLDVAGGQEVLLGEPVGVISAVEDDHSGTAIVYYELRHRGRPVDPLDRLSSVQGRGSG